MGTRWLSIWIWTVAAAAVPACSTRLSEAGDDVVLTAGDPTVAKASPCDTRQFFGDARHGGHVCAGLPGDEPLGVRAAVTIDPDAARFNDDLGFYAVHASQALTRGAMVYVGVGAGYSDLFHKGTKSYALSAYRWSGSLLTPAWSYSSGWRSIQALSSLSSTVNVYEPVFQAALARRARARDVVLVPERAGRVAELDPDSGELLRVIDPFAGTSFSGDSATIVDGGIAVDDAGNGYYVVAAWDPSGSSSVPPRASWLVRVGADDVATTVLWSSIATPGVGVKQAADLCSYAFQFASPTPPRPWPAMPDTTAPQFHCSPQRPSVNDTPMITRDGKIVLISTANNAITTAYVLVVDAATLAPVRAMSLRDHIADGCGVKVPFSATSDDDPGDFSRCRLGSRVGVDLNFNEPVAGGETGIMEVSTIEAPDGSIYVSSYSGGYDNNQGHLFRFSPSGVFLGLTDYGWEMTPAIFSHSRDGGGGGGSLDDQLDFDLVADHNLFSPITGDGGPGVSPVVVAYAPDLTDRYSLTVDPDPTAGFNDFVDGQPLVSADGSSLRLSARGILYRVSRAGRITGQVILGSSVETLSYEGAWGVDDAGNSVAYVPYAGTMFAIGAGRDSRQVTGVIHPAHLTAVTGARRRGE